MKRKDAIALLIKSDFSKLSMAELSAACQCVGVSGRGARNELTMRLERVIKKEDSTKRFYLRRHPIDAQGYDSSGGYWGIGAPLWYYMSEDCEDEDHIRASNRAAAKAALRVFYPNATFFR